MASSEDKCPRCGAPTYNLDGLQCDRRWVQIAIPRKSDRTVIGVRERRQGFAVHQCRGKR